MPVFALPPRHQFPDPSLAEPSGLLAVGGDLAPRRVLTAYDAGIFPWPSDDELLWFSPDPRMVLWPGEEHVSRSLRKLIASGRMELRVNTAFSDVMRACALTPRRGQPGTSITVGMWETYCELHRAGHAHSFEAWQEGELVGGLYGVLVGRVFAGESMFHKVTDASKFAFVGMARHLWSAGCMLVDCQMHTEHLASLGAREIPRAAFLSLLAQGRAEAEAGSLVRLPPPTGIERVHRRR